VGVSEKKSSFFFWIWHGFSKYICAKLPNHFVILRSGGSDNCFLKQNCLTTGVFGLRSKSDKVG
jgi:hypothetical protein